MALTNFQVYFHPWQLPLIYLFVLGWLVGGAYLLRRSAILRGIRHPRKVSFTRCAKIIFLTVVIGAVCAVVIFFLFRTISLATGSNLTYLGVAIGFLTFLVVCALAINAYFSLSVGEGATVAWLPVGAIVLLGIILGLVAFIPARLLWMKDLQRIRTTQNLALIRRALMAYERHYYRLPDRLQELSIAGHLPEEILVSPLRPHWPVGYFYRPLVPPPPGDDRPRLVACSYLNPQYGDGRAMYFSNGLCRWCDAHRVETVLKDEVNAEFATVLRTAESALRAADSALRTKP